MPVCENCGSFIDTGNRACTMCGAPAGRSVSTHLGPQVRSEVLIHETFQYGGFWARFVAKLIDTLIVGAIYLLLEEGFIPYYGDNPISDLILIFVFPLIRGIYDIYFIGSTGQTPGKKLMKLRVLGDDGQRVGYKTATIRWLGEMVTIHSTFLLGYLSIIIDARKKALHDKIAGTIVCKESESVIWRTGGWGPPV
jgi:uncharacterized RDD family membrane protein YckC